MCRRPSLTPCATASARASASAARRQSCAAMAAWPSATSRSSITLRRHSRPCGAAGVGQQRVDLRTQLAAGLGAEAARVQAHLVGQAGDAQARQPRAPRRRRPARPAVPARGARRLRRPAMRAIVRKPSSTASGRALRSSTSSRLASSAPASSGWLRSHSAAASTAASMQVKGLRRPRSPSARASVGRSSFSASSTWPSHR